MRFVFGILNLQGREFADQAGTKLSDKCASLGEPSKLFNGNISSLSNVILEFAVDKADQAAVKAWGQRWIDLNKNPINSSSYRVALENITQSVVKAGVGGSKRANQSALNVIRTNESTDDDIWEFREFKIDPKLHYPVATTVSQTPNANLNANPDQISVFAPPPDRSGDLTAWLSMHRSEVIAETHVIPATFAQTGVSGWKHKYFLAGHAFSDKIQPMWDTDFKTDFDTRFHFAVNTCNGCHTTENMGTLAGNLGVFHIEGREWNNKAKLSEFLTGQKGNDAGNPVGSQPYMAEDPKSHQFRPFAELERRRQDLAAYMSAPAAAALSFQPSTQTH